MSKNKLLSVVASRGPCGADSTHLLFTRMPGKQGGKQKPLTAPKKDKRELDDDDIAAAEKRKAEAKALKDAAAKLKK